MTLAGVDREELLRLAQALRDSGAAAPDAQLITMSPQPIGIGAMADTFRIELSWSADGAGPRSLVAQPAGAAKARDRAGGSDARGAARRVSAEQAPTHERRADVAEDRLRASP